MTYGGTRRTGKRGEIVRTIELKGADVILVDQTLLPHKLKFIRCTNAEGVAQAIEKLQVRGAPALAAAAAMGIAVTALRSRAKTKPALMSELELAAKRIGKTRPTAVNLFVGIRRALSAARKYSDVESMKKAVVKEANLIAEEDIKTNKKLGENGAKLLKSGATVLTHCNAGALATVDFGTALGVIRAAKRAGKKLKVMATETRPLHQGARLTAWELKREGIPVTVIVDSSVGHFMDRGGINAAIVGADRIAANGDAANKIGTYNIAVLAREHHIPFYVAAPTSTIDMKIRRGKDIPIEYRSPEEVTSVGGRRIAPSGVNALNPAFDVTPARLITAIITEQGVFKPDQLKSKIKS
ncbi:MAG: S-methyl-5-thioribose-1-phosphate isomerase [Candidatus Hadarchaeota archaeon]